MKDHNRHAVFKETLSKVIDLLVKRDINGSYELITKAITLDIDAPEPHNLLGILLELKGDDNTARKHYRAAYALDPTYKPACRNLERLVTLEWGLQSRDFDFGDHENVLPVYEGEDF